MAKKSKPIAQTVHIGRVNLIRFANKVIDKVFLNTVFRSKDVKDKPFKPYSDQEPFFFFNKKIGKVVRAQGYKQTKAEGGGSQGSGTKVDLFASGKMMRSLLIRSGQANDDNIPVGWVNPKSAQKLVWNASDRGKNREVANSKGTFPFAPSVEKMFFNDVNKVLDKKVKKTSERIVFKINM